MRDMSAGHSLLPVSPRFRPRSRNPERRWSMRRYTVHLFPPNLSFPLPLPLLAFLLDTNSGRRDRSVDTERYGRGIARTTLRNTDLVARYNTPFSRRAFLRTFGEVVNPFRSDGRQEEEEEEREKNQEPTLRDRVQPLGETQTNARGP